VRLDGIGVPVVIECGHEILEDEPHGRGSPLVQALVLEVGIEGSLVQEEVQFRPGPIPTHRFWSPHGNRDLGPCIDLLPQELGDLSNGISCV